MNSIMKLVCYVFCVILGASFSDGFAPTRRNGNGAIAASRGTTGQRLSFCTDSSSRPVTFSQQQQQKSPLYMSQSNNDSSKQLPMLLDPGTKGGALFLSLVLFIIPLVGYTIATSVFGLDEIETGKWIGVGFTVLTMLLWLGTYLFRVATKDMTYAKQLKDYENAVIAKRLEELDEDEVQALVEDIERDDF